MAEKNTLEEQLKAAQDAAAVAPDLYNPESDQAISAITAQIAEAQKKVEESSKLSAEEEAAQKQLDDEQAALNLGLVDVAGQPIPLGFITGQQKALESRSLARTQPLQSQLARLQQRRASALDVAKSSLTNLKDTKSSKLASYDTNYNRKVSKQDAATKRTQDAADKAEQNRYKVIGDGSQLYDTLTGKVINNNPKNFAPKAPVKAPVKTTTKSSGRSI